MNLQDFMRSTSKSHMMLMEQRLRYLISFKPGGVVIVLDISQLGCKTREEVPDVKQRHDPHSWTSQRAFKVQSQRCHIMLRISRMEH